MAGIIYAYEGVIFMFCVPTDLPVLHLLPEDSKYPFSGNGKSHFTVLQFYYVLDMPVEFSCTYSKNLLCTCLSQNQYFDFTLIWCWQKQGIGR